MLMEAVLVLPLYLTLLGGLFIIGDMLMGRLRLSIVERNFVWLLGDRHGLNDNRENLRAALLEMVPEKDYPAGGSRAWVRRANDGNYVENEWLHLVEGASRMVVDVGLWAGMANAQQNMAGDAGEPLLFENENPLFDGDNSVARAFVVRRRPGAEKPRGESGIAVDDAEKAWDILPVLNDELLFAEDSAIPIAPAPLPDLPRHPSIQLMGE